MFIYYYTYPNIGRVGIAECDDCICGIYWDNKEPKIFEVKETPLIKKADAQLKEFFAGNRKEFDLPIKFIKGTPFQREVWQALIDIPYGQTKSYREVAEYIGRPKACRAVGMGNHRNPISIVVPCHRVVNHGSGGLGGYAGGLDVKQFLLDLESKNLIKIED